MPVGATPQHYVDAGHGNHDRDNGIQRHAQLRKPRGHCARGRWPFRRRRGGNCRRCEGGNVRLDRRDEAVAPPGQRLDEARGFCDIAERRAEFPDGVVDALFEIDERVAVPERMLKIVARDDHPRMFQQKSQDLERLRTDRNATPVLRQFERQTIEVEDTETPPASAPTSR